MKAANYAFRETDSFAPQPTFGELRPAITPIVGRMRAMWLAMRAAVMAVFPMAPGLPKDCGDYLKFVDEFYQSDAYQSLSIEGYRVTPELIDRVRVDGWALESDDPDRKDRDALAASGYWQAFQAVKATVSDVIAGAHPGTVARTAHRDWPREFFQPSVAAGVLRLGALAGYRSDAVYLRRSRYVPPRWEALRDAMPALFDLLERETEPSARGALLTYSAAGRSARRRRSEAGRSTRPSAPTTTP